MKTAIQELIEWLNDYPTNVPTIHKSAVISKAESMLEKEKEQMIDFARNIIIDATCSVEGYVTTEKDIEEYYNETFNTKEK